MEQRIVCSSNTNFVCEAKIWGGSQWIQVSFMLHTNLLHFFKPFSDIDITQPSARFFGFGID
jgi:hypothetical protein